MTAVLPSHSTGAVSDEEITRLRETIYTDGIVGLPGLMPREWAETMRREYDPRGTTPPS